MAEVGVHLATTSTELPSIFEVLAQENLNWILRPAFGHLIKVLADVDPLGRLALVFKWREEIFTGLDLVLQHYCLKKCGASFAEQFYGLRRHPVNGGGQKPRADYRLPTSVHRWSLFCLVFVPYLKLRMDAIYEDLVDSNETTATNADINAIRRRMLAKAFLSVYPFMHLLWEMSVLCHQVSYTLGKQKYPSPLYWLARSQLVTLSEEDATFNPIVVLWNEMRKLRSYKELPAFLLRYVTGFYTELFTAALSLGTFFLRFLEWRYNAAAAVDPISLLNPPRFPRPPTDFPKDRSHCPVCHKVRTNEAALSTSGYVFCYPCIHRYVKQHGTCPVTRLPSITSNIVRIFSDNN